jgi:hypothetical protein
MKKECGVQLKRTRKFEKKRANGIENEYKLK